MKLRYTILYVDNVEETIVFYEKAFGLKRLMIHESGAYGELDTGETKLSFSSIELMESIGKKIVRPNPLEPSFEIAFETSEVKSAVDKAVKTGATLIQEPEEMPWGQTVAYVADKNGFLVEICTPILG